MSVQINQLTASTPTASHNVPVYDPATGDTRRWSLSELLTWLQSNLDLGRPEANTQYAAPSATGFTVTITNADDDVHLILTPVAGYAAGTIVLPAYSVARDKQVVTVNCTQSVGTLTINGNGAVAVTGAPTSLTANAFFTLCYDAVMQTWYRIY